MGLPGHRAVLLIVAAAAAALLVAARWLRGREDRLARRLLAVALIGNELLSWSWAAAHGVVRVPLQLCDLAVGLMAWALWTLRPRACELIYFWGLAGSFQALATPDLNVGLPARSAVHFFLSHGGVVLLSVYLAVTGRVQATWGSVARVWGVTNLYAAAAGLINGLWGANYGYLARKPSQPSLLDVLGPWPWYIVGMEGLALVFFVMLYLPLASARRLAMRGR